MWRYLTLGLLSAGGLSCSAPVEVAPVTAQAPVLRKLTQPQYERAVRSLFGQELFVPPRLEPDLRSSGSVAVSTALAAISPRGVENYEQAAYSIASQAVDPAVRESWMPCELTSATADACVQEMVAVIGRRAWRRPLTDEEQASLAALAEEASAALGDVWAGIEFVVAALLQSPDFLMIPEYGESDPVDGGRRYSSWEMASRVSFLLWDSIPDDTLLDAAASGALLTDDGLDAQVIRMLEDPRAKEGLRAWVDDWLHLEELDHLEKDPDVFVYLSDGLGQSAREETQLGIEYIVFEEDGDFRDLLTTRRAFLDTTLATLYNVQAPSRDGFGETMLPTDIPRLGLFGQVSLLATHAHAISTSPTLRGLFVREAMLCQPLPAPPADVDTSIPAPTEEAPTFRDRVQQHLEQPGCSGCHQLTDPIGLALEHFDGLGRHRLFDEGAEIDASGALDGVEFTDAEGLAFAVREHPSLVPCMVKQLLRRAQGRKLGQGEEDGVTWLADRFAERDHRLQPLLLELIQHPMFRKVGEVSP